MLKSSKEKMILKQGILVLGVIGGLYLFVLSPFLKEGSSILDEELERKTADVNRFFLRTGSMPSKKGFEKMEKEELEMKKSLQDLMNFVDPVKVRLSESSTEAGLYFIEKLHNSTRQFLDQADSKGIKLPENLGFDGSLPKDNFVDVLLRQLETVEGVMGILLESQRIEVSLIKPLKPIDYVESLSKETLYTELPVQISIKTDTETFMKLLVGVKNRSPVVSVKEVHIKSSESETGDIEVSLVLSTFKVARAVE